MIEAMPSMKDLRRCQKGHILALSSFLTNGINLILFWTSCAALHHSVKPWQQNCDGKNTQKVKVESHRPLQLFMGKGNAPRIPMPRLPLQCLRWIHCHNIGSSELSCLAGNLWGRELCPHFRHSFENSSLQKVIPLDYRWKIFISF